MGRQHLRCVLPAESRAEVTDELYQALAQRGMVEPLTARYPQMTMDDAYQISLALLERRLAAGEHVVGKKIGVTSRVVQEMLGVDQPDFGFLTDSMVVADGAQIEASARFIQPRIEGEIAFRLQRTLRGPGIDAETVLAATEAVLPCFEIVDSRIRDWKITILDTVADNASCGAFVLGAMGAAPGSVDLDDVTLEVRRNGRQLSTGQGRAVLGGPAGAVAWLANTLARYGVALEAGEIVLSGSCVPLEPVVAGDLFELEMVGVGECRVAFC